MLARVKKTPTKLDDFFVLVLGVLTLLIPLAHIFRILPIPFDWYLAVLGGAVPALLFCFLLARTIRAWLDSGREAPLTVPAPTMGLLLALGLGNLLVFGWYNALVENPLTTNLWLVVTCYAISAVLLGEYGWPVEFSRFVAHFVALALGLAQNGAQTARQAAAKTVEHRAAIVQTSDDEDDLPPAFMPSTSLKQVTEARILEAPSVMEVGPAEFQPEEAVETDPFEGQGSFNPTRPVKVPEEHDEDELERYFAENINDRDHPLNRFVFGKVVRESDGKYQARYFFNRIANVSRDGNPGGAISNFADMTGMSVEDIFAEINRIKVN